MRLQDTLASRIDIGPSPRLTRMALRDLGIAVRNSPHYGQAYGELGQVLLERGELGKAIHVSRRALSLGVKHPWQAYTTIGSAYWQRLQHNPSLPQGLESFSQADAALTQAIAAHPHHPQNYLSYQLRAQLHHQAAQVYGYPGASLSQAGRDREKARSLYQQTSLGVAQRLKEAADSQQQRLEQEAQRRRLEQYGLYSSQDELIQSIEKAGAPLFRRYSP